MRGGLIINSFQYSDHHKPQLFCKPALTCIHYRPRAAAGRCAVLCKYASQFCHALSCRSDSQHPCLMVSRMAFFQFCLDCKSIHTPQVGGIQYLHPVINDIDIHGRLRFALDEQAHVSGIPQFCAPPAVAVAVVPGACKRAFCTDREVDAVGGRCAGQGAVHYGKQVVR